MNGQVCIHFSLSCNNCHKCNNVKYMHNVNKYGCPYGYKCKFRHSYQNNFYIKTNLANHLHNLQQQTKMLSVEEKNLINKTQAYYDKLQKLRIIENNIIKVINNYSNKSEEKYYKKQNIPKEKPKVIWLWNSHNCGRIDCNVVNYKEYNPVFNKIFEEHYKNNKYKFKISIASTIYNIDLNEMTQTNEKTLTEREIKRTFQKPFRIIKTLEEHQLLINIRKPLSISHNVEYIALPKNIDEYKTIEKLIGNYKAVKIERVHMPKQTEIYNITEKYETNGVNEIIGFHGTKENVKSICESELKVEMSKGGYLGHGIYCSSKIDYSSLYCPNETVIKIFIVKMLVGNVKDYGYVKQTSLKSPPSGYDSCSMLADDPNNTRMFCVYENKRVLITHIVHIKFPNI